MDIAVKERLPWYRSTLTIAVIGSFLLWAALPPLAWSWLAWIAPVPWLLLARGETLPGCRPYRALWLAGFVFWLMALHWLRLPHPATSLGWLALSAYLACYLPVFVGLSRVAVHKLHVPLWLAAPVVWTGLELARAHLLTGFLMSSLAHTQVHRTPLIQISDLVGEYGIDFVIMTVAAGLTCVAFQPRRIFAALPAIAVLAATLAYGYSRLDGANRKVLDQQPETIRIALIQGNSLADWKFDQEKQRQIMEEYVRLSEQAVDRAKTFGNGRPPDLIVWPETMYRNPLREFEGGFQLPTELEQTTAEVSAADRRQLADMVTHLGTPLLVGIDRILFLAVDRAATEYPAFRAYNSAALVDRTGRVVGTYDKFHLVMFGEYVPFAGWLPFLKGLSSLTGSVEAGTGPVALCTGGICYAPNICYETVMPHVIRRHITTLEQRRQSPDVLVNLTNDAWYWGSSELDMHLACGVFRAVETRKPLVIAANGGISAWIDRFGRIRAQSPRQQPHIILADVERGYMHSWYMKFGDWFAAACLTCCAVLAIINWPTRRLSPPLTSHL